MQSDKNGLPIIDWELGRRLAGNQIDLAKDMISGLVKTLPHEFSEINNFAANRNHAELLKSVHKLHGAVAYCGTPRLKIALANLESQLKRQPNEDITEPMQALECEVNALLRESHQA